MIIVSFVGDGRSLRYLINSMLKSGMATEIKRINYVKSYSLVENKVSKLDEKILWVFYEVEKKDKLLSFIKKNNLRVLQDVI